MLNDVLKSPSMQASVVYGIGGIGFAVGTIILAKSLPAQEFAWVALVLAIGQLTNTVGPLGANTLVVRYPVNPDTGLLYRIFLSSSVVAVVASAVAWIVYELSGTLTILAAIAFAAASVNLVGASIFRSRGRFLTTLAFTQIQNIVIVIAALVTVVTSLNTALTPVGLIALAFALSAAVAWFGAFNLAPIDNATRTSELPWKEGRTILYAAVAVTLLIQLERLSIPKLLDNESLATFAILASIAGSPFRLLQMGVNLTLVPRLRQAGDAAARIRILKVEAFVAFLVAGVAAVVVWLFAQPFVDWFLENRYELSDGLIAAAVVAGFAKVISALASAGVTALGSARELSRLSISSWLAVGVGAVGAVVGAGYGLTGIVLGVSTGWIFLAVVATFLSMPQYSSAR